MITVSHIYMLTSAIRQIKWGIILQGLVADPQAKHYHRMNSSIWLFLYLLTTVNHKTGRLTTSIETIATQMGVKANTVDSWLGILKSKDYVELVKNNGQTMIQIARWRKVAPLYLLKSVPETLSKKPTKTERRQPFVSEFEKEANEVASQLDDTDNAAAYIHLFNKYPRDIIDKALKAVKSLPDEKIKKSRGALFTFLVKKYAQKN